MPRFNFDNDSGGGPTFIKGKRYTLVVADSKEGTSKDKGTPYWRLKLETEDLENAHDKTLWLTEKAIYRAKEWVVALGFKPEGDINVDPATLKGIRFTAEATYRKADDGKEYIEWEKPLPLKIGGDAPAPAAAPASAATPPAAEQRHPAAAMAPQNAPRPEAGNDDVPF